MTVYGSLPPSLRIRQIHASYEAARLFVRAARKAFADAKAEPFYASRHLATACGCLCIAETARAAARSERKSLRADLNKLFDDVLPVLERIAHEV